MRIKYVFSTAGGRAELWKSVLQIGPSIWFASTDVKSDKLFSTAGARCHESRSVNILDVS
jgi:hypothetical protein